MGVIKNRMKQVFMGNVRFQNQLSMKASSGASTQFFGVARINSGAATCVVSTTVVKSNDWFALTPVIRGALQNSLAPLLVSTITEGGFFTIAWGNGGNVPGTVVDACWEIRRIVS